MYINRRMDKQNVVYKHNEMLFSLKDILIHLGIWMNLENVLSEVSQTQKDRYYVTALT